MFSEIELIVANTNLKYREEWLYESLMRLDRHLFSRMKYQLPKQIQVSCGFPSTRALAAGRRVIGECWYPQGSDIHQLFISPVLSDPVQVLGTLVHEVVHTIAGSKAAHGSEFRYIATRVGLIGKMTATEAGPHLVPLLKTIVNELGEYPHTPIDKTPRKVTKGEPTITSGECTGCGYRATVSFRWVAEAGYPICPTCNVELSPRLGLMSG